MANTSHFNWFSHITFPSLCSAVLYISWIFGISNTNQGTISVLQVKRPVQSGTAQTVGVFTCCLGD